MKKLLKIEGTTILDRKALSKINGAARYACVQRGRYCCELAPGGEFCDAGQCTGIGGSGGCFWY